MLPWAVMFVVVVTAGVAVLAWFSVGFVRDVRRLGRTVAGASRRLEQASDHLRDTVAEPRPGPAPRARAARVPAARVRR